MRNTLILSAFAAAMAGSFLAAAPASADPFDGFYVGAEAGYSSSSFESRIAPDVTLGGDGFNGGLVAGYGKLFDNIYLGGELGGYLSNSSISGSVAGASYEASIRDQIDVSVMPGYLISPETLVYARLGYAYGRMDGKVDTGAGAANAKWNSDGWVLGAGVWLALTDTVGLRADYSRTMFGKATIPGTGQDVSVTDNSVRVGLTYSF